MKSGTLASQRAVRARFHAWSAQINLFLSELPPEGLRLPAIDELTRRRRELRRRVRDWSGAEPGQAAVNRAWTQLHRAWSDALDATHQQTGPAR
jgi:hypothetical protein